ncbi:pyruvate kinase, partial [bacterium]|nr:pyruvate kinase [bacterium]
LESHHKQKVSLKKIVTLGPATNTKDKLEKIKDKGVDFVRINMSHSTIEDLEYFIDLSKEVGIEFIIDTEGSQIRTGKLNKNSISFIENDQIKIYNDSIIGDNQKINLTPKSVVEQLNVGDILYVDFDTLTISISDILTLDKGFIVGKVLSAGDLGNNKGVIVDRSFKKKINIPMLSLKDLEAIKLGLKKEVKYIAASFVRSGANVKKIKELTNNTMKIISKVECIDGLENIDDIITESDYLLIDRGDLSKEIPIEKIPFTQKIILNKAKQKDTEVFVATNLLESMIENRKPTRAEVHDILNTIVDGASGLVLAAETAIGKYPLGCVNMLNKIIKHSALVINANEIQHKEKDFVNHLNSLNYLLDHTISSSLIEPNGGLLISKLINEEDEKYEESTISKTYQISDTVLQDLEQIAIGTYSPLNGFLTKKELESVLNKMRLPNGLIWPIPILLDIDSVSSKDINVNDKVGLTNSKGVLVGSIIVKDNYSFSKEKLVQKFYGTTDKHHPGVKMVYDLKSNFLGGEISLFCSKISSENEYNFHPSQVRKLFEEKNWTKIVGFHTRNVIHRAHEHIQKQALIDYNCDGLLLHPVIGEKKKGDFKSSYIVKSYEYMMKNVYKNNQAVFGTFSTYSRYGGQKEALFTAICRQNFGCSHFIIGRDHTGSGYSGAVQSESIFNMFSDLEIKIIQFGSIEYSPSVNTYIENSDGNAKDTMKISGTEAREKFMNLDSPPEWHIRKEISKMIIDALKNNKKVFVN